MPQLKEISLLKASAAEGECRERFVFRYQPGCEEELLDAFVDMANDRGNEFDWFDAAVLSFQLSKQLVEEADELLCPHGQSAQTGSTDSNDKNHWDFP